MPMHFSNPSLHWNLLDDVFYRSRPCYEHLEWTHLKDDPSSSDFDLATYNVSIGPYASLIALYPKHVFGISQTEKIIITTGVGHEIFSILWNFTMNPIASIGWTRKGELLLVLVSGKYRIYYNYNGDFEEFDIFTELCADDDDSTRDGQCTIASVVFSNVGFTVQTSNNVFVYIQNSRKPTKHTTLIFKQLATSPPIDPYHITAWTTMTPVDSTLKSLRDFKLYAFTTAGLCILHSSLLSQPQSPSQSQSEPPLIYGSLLNSVYSAEISWNQSFVAVHSTTPSKLYIFDSEFNDLLLEHDIDTAPISISWCSSDVVALSYATHVLVVGPSSNTLHINTQELPHLHNEQDGLYLLASHTLSLFSKVAPITESTFKIGSTSPSSILLDSIEYLDKHSPRANDMLDIISEDLVMAVDGCIRAAAEEFDVYWQKNLLRAANFGKVQLDLYDPAEFVSICDTIRVLNILRSSDIGMPLTFVQFQELGVQPLIDMLLLRKLHYLCLKVCDFLNVPKYKVVTHWACTKIKYSSGISDDELLDSIVEKLNEVTGIDWTDLATVAYIEGRTKLSRELLSYEPNTKRKVQFLIEVNTDTHGDEMEFALAKADEDGDVDSLALVLLQLYGSLSNVEFFKAIGDKKNAVGVLKSLVYQCYTRGGNEDGSGDLLKNFMYQDDDIMGLIILELQKLKMRNGMDGISKEISKLQTIVTRSKQTAYIAASVSNEGKIHKLQTDLKISDKYEDVIPGEPALDTIAKIIPIDLKAAQSYVRKMGISQVQFTYTVLQTLSKDSSKHAELYEFAQNSGGKTITFEPFYYELLKRGMKRQAGMYLPHCKTMTSMEKVRGYIICGMWKDAVLEAAERKNLELLRSMRDSRDGWESKLANDEIERITGSRE
jgi:hypothetical protein